VLIGLSVLFASGADAAIYAYALRERPPHLWCCLGGGRQREKEAADARFESHAVGATAIFVNGTACMAICATLFRRRREKERLTSD